MVSRHEIGTRTRFHIYCGVNARLGAFSTIVKTGLGTDGSICGTRLDTRGTMFSSLHEVTDHCPASPRPRPGRALTSCSASAMVPGSSVPAVSGSRTAVAPPSSVATPKMRKGR